MIYVYQKSKTEDLTPEEAKTESLRKQIEILRKTFLGD